ncbi:unnamed protein product [Candidula unifasciata]|uniref:SLIT-ROBO Rho GTPase-activating protein 1 n=1 Tax=Candidula unifasciata TaxID=100452 RepID=A0A8S3YRH1_9EUPU|nr:unnamed protein product [Candidula unifasciata]
MRARNRYSLFACTRPQETWYTETPHIIDIRQQLNDQLKCLEVKLETEVSIVTELQEFFRRRAELEQEYARNLDKLVRNMITRHRAEKNRSEQEQWATMSTYACWKLLVGITRKQSQDHQTMAEIYSNQMVSRLAEVIDNSQRIFRKCRDIGAESHEDIMKVLNELQSAMKTYHLYQNESKQAELKLRNVESQKQKVEQQLSSKNTTSRKLKGLERQAEKKQQKYADNKVKALKARNDYLLSIDAANAAINKYFSDDISDLMDCMDFGYHHSVGRVMMMYLGIHEHQKMTHVKSIEQLNKCITDLDSRADKQKFMELNNIYFMLPKKFDYQPFKGDEVCQISAQKEVQEDLIQRHATIEDRLNSLKAENDEIWKTLETTERTLVDTVQVKDYDVTKFFADESAPPRSPQEMLKHKAERLETESYYLEKFREYTLSCNRLARLQSKNAAIQKALGENQDDVPTRPPMPPPKPKKRRIGHHPPVGQPKLFTGSLEEYIEATGQEIPLVIKSCIRVINLYGLHHQGVFRVSGAQVEISQFKNIFESGEDALADVMDASDINSVAGVLKLYFRELREPLFPLHLFDALVECAREKEMPKRVQRIKDLLSSINRPIWIVMRYLFAFLNHLTEYSDENMMDPYNLAICFGPTLLPIPPDRDQVTFQSSVNEIIKIIIVHQEEIFPNDGGEIYEKMLLDRRDSVDAIDEDDEETSSLPSDEEESVYEPDVFEATAVFDFEARSPRELTFRRGDTLVLYNQMSSDWWEGCFRGKEGLIPDKYISIADSNKVLEQKGRTDVHDFVHSIISADTTPEDLSVDIDTALEEVMAGLKSLEMQQQLDKRMSLPAVKVKQTPKHTPDLVLDLPDGDMTSSCTDSIEQNSPTISAAENFAKSNQGTLKKARAPPLGRQDPTNRLSISSEPGDLARSKEPFEKGMDTISKQVPLSTFSLKRAQSVVQSREKFMESCYRTEPPSASSSSISASTPITSCDAPTFTSTPSFTPSPPLPASFSSLTSGPPPVAQKPKPPMKVKPPVMRKPASRPDVSSSPPLQPPQ